MIPIFIIKSENVYKEKTLFEIIIKYYLFLLK